MITASNSPLPVLAPPGAGLPLPELWIARLLFWRARLGGSRAKFTSEIESEQKRVLELIKPLSAEAAGQRVLIKRLPGMEDSSRFWSVWMTLDHLRIVNLAIAGIIASLGQDELPHRVARTADVKPSPGADAGVVSSFDQSCETLLANARQIPDLKTRLRHPHPWFGPLKAEAWYAMAGFHLGLHRTQIQRIVALL